MGDARACYRDRVRVRWGVLLREQGLGVTLALALLLVVVGIGAQQAVLALSALGTVAALLGLLTWAGWHVRRMFWACVAERTAGAADWGAVVAHVALWNEIWGAPILEVVRPRAPVL